MPTHWAIDLGTSNTTICEDRSGRPRAVHAGPLARVVPLTQTPVVPSCVCVLDPAAKQVLIGQEAIQYNWDGQAPGFATGFKWYLGPESSRVMARLESRLFTAHDVTELFLRGLLERLEQGANERIYDLTLSAPSGVYETYRAELQNIARRVLRGPWWRRLWARMRSEPPVTFRTIDEPVAAALGYGVDVGRAGVVVAFDFGAGSMEAAVIRTGDSQTVERGRAMVLAKQDTRLGGNDVDRWIVERFIPEDLRHWPERGVGQLWEAERVKLMASAGGVPQFTFDSRIHGTLDIHELRALLEDRGVFAAIRELIGRLLEELREAHGFGPEDVNDVLLEGGSTLLPGVRDQLGELFGRDRIREWLPFESVARGACVFAAGARVEDFIYHDYAVRVASNEAGDSEYELLIPAGTRYPTAPDFATRYYAPGFDGQESLNLFVCEVGRVAGRRVTWEGRPNGSRYYAPATVGEAAFCVCLNELDPALPLNPPGHGTAPRLRVTYMVNEDRWLCATVHDLETKEDLRVAEPVVRLR